MVVFLWTLLRILSLKQHTLEKRVHSFTVDANWCPIWMPIALWKIKGSRTTTAAMHSISQKSMLQNALCLPSSNLFGYPMYSLSTDWKGVASLAVLQALRSACSPKPANVAGKTLDRGPEPAYASHYWFSRSDSWQHGYYWLPWKNS